MNPAAPTPSSWRRVAALATGSMLLGAVGLLGTAAPAAADTAPAAVTPTTPVTVSADPLPTVQIDGVAWSQVVVGNTVYVAGKFTTARPAGAAAGVSTTPRSNLLAYDIRTGELVTSFAPSLNAQAMVVTASPDGSRIYVGGDFTEADGQPRSRVAAYDTATGQLVPSFKPWASWQVRAIAATDSTVYLGGGFASVGSAPRDRLAAVRASDGGLLPWAPTLGTGSTAGNSNGSTATSKDVLGLVVTGGGTQVVAAGRFDSINGVKSTGVGAIDAVTGETRPFALGQLLTNQGINSAVYSLQAKGDTVYGTAYDFYGPGNLEGSFAAAADGGAVKWINECHGDTYSGFPTGGAYYVATHAHVCSNIGGFPEYSPRVNRFGLAFSDAPSGGVVGNSTLANGNLRGQPATKLLPWFPDLVPGKYTGQGQAGWSVAGNDQYVVFGGEFPRAGGKPQQGLVRYALPSLAPNEQGPAPITAAPALQGLVNGAVRLTFGTTSDRDNENLVYDVFRDGDTRTPVQSTTAASTFYQAKTLSLVDTGLVEGSTVSYRVRASDPFGNVAWSPSASVQVPDTAAQLGPYGSSVLHDAPSSFWRLGEASGNALDVMDRNAMSVATGVTRGRPGAVPGVSDTAFQFDGTRGFTATTVAETAPQVFTVEAWVQTTTTRGGKVLGFGSSRTGLSGSYDRHLYLENDGRVVFGVNDGANRVVRSTAAVNDGRWHHLVGSMSPQGMVLFVDGQQVGQRAATTTASTYQGYWRLGGDRVWSGTSPYLAGTVDEAAVYPVALTPQQVRQHWLTGSTGVAANTAPTARIAAEPTFLDVAFSGTGSTDRDGTVAAYAWDFGDGTTATGPAPRHAYAAAGSYPVRLTVTDDDGETGTTTTTVTVAAAPPNAAPTASFTSSASFLAASFDATASSDADGTVASYTWAFGDGATGGGPTAQHAYAAAGTYDVTLTVTDDDGATATTTQQVTVAAPPPNAAPQASFTAAARGLVADFDGRASSDADGSVVAWEWAFGDGTTATGATPSHAYASSGTYDVTLTVVDDLGARTSATGQVAVSGPFVEDLFQRTTTGGLGTADVGGTWSTATGGPTTRQSVSPGAALFDLRAAGDDVGAWLPAVSQPSADLRTTLSLTGAPTASGVNTHLLVRRVTATNDYRGRLRFLADGSVWVALSKRAGSTTETTLGAEVRLPGTYAAGQELEVRVVAAAPAGGATTLSLTAWPKGTPEPAAPTLTRTDATAALQAPGSVGLNAYLSGKATAASGVRFTAFSVRAAQ